MSPFEIDSSSSESIKESFNKVAEKIFNDIQLEVNDNYYRVLDIEFYYFAPLVFEDIYAHQHQEQLKMGNWYFHGSGIDITFGNGKNYGGILIRAIAKLSGDISRDENFIEKEIHGPLNVKTEIGSKLHDVFNQTPNIFQLHDVSRDRMPPLMKMPTHIIRTSRIGLNETKDITTQKEYFNGKFRFVIFPHLKLKDKTQISKDMQAQYPELTVEEINKLLGSKFL